jgi:hypothetical protein
MKNTYYRNLSIKVRNARSISNCFTKEEVERLVLLLELDQANNFADTLRASKELNNIKIK